MILSLSPRLVRLPASRGVKGSGLPEAFLSDDSFCVQRVCWKNYRCLLVLPSIACRPCLPRLPVPCPAFSQPSPKLKLPLGMEFLASACPCPYVLQLSIFTLNSFLVRLLPFTQHPGSEWGSPAPPEGSREPLDHAADSQPSCPSLPLSPCSVLAHCFQIRFCLGCHSQVLLYLVVAEPDKIHIHEMCDMYISQFCPSFLLTLLLPTVRLLFPDELCWVYRLI